MKEIRLIAEEHLTYVPHHVAQHLGLFEQRGISVDVHYNSGPGGSWLADILAAGDADIARGGVWIPLMYRNRLENLRIFAQLCGMNTQVLFGRNPSAAFEWKDLYDKKVLLPASSTSQWMFFKGVLKEAKVDLTRITFIRDLDELTTSRLWRAGFTDFYLTYSPLAEELVNEGYPVAADFSVKAGAVPWSVYYTTPAYLENNRAHLTAFVQALSDAGKWMQDHSAAQIGALIKSDFPNVSQSVLAAAINRMASNGTWSPDMSVRSQPLMRYQGMIASYGLIEALVPYDAIVDVSCL